VICGSFTGDRNSSLGLGGTMLPAMYMESEFLIIYFFKLHAFYHSPEYSPE
jgi:hypothetical protein